MTSSPHGVRQTSSLRQAGPAVAHDSHDRKLTGFFWHPHGEGNPHQRHQPGPVVGHSFAKRDQKR